MGASGWLVITPWRQDLATSLRYAQRETFLAGRFQDPGGLVADPAAAIAALDEIALPPDLEAADQADLLAFLQAEAAQQREAIARYQAAQTVDEQVAALRLAAGFEGTHSVIDLPGVEALKPLDPQVLVAHFGTTQPDVATLRADGHGLETHVGDRGTGVWIRLQNREGDWLAIVGVSGD